MGLRKSCLARLPATYGLIGSKMAPTVSLLFIVTVHALAWLATGVQLRDHPLNTEPAALAATTTTCDPAGKLPMHAVPDPQVMTTVPVIVPAVPIPAVTVPDPFPTL